MEDKIKTLYELCETISRELEDANEKIRNAGGKVSAGDVDYLDKLTHSLKSIKTTIAMMESEDEGGYSGRYMPMYGMSYERGGNRGSRSNRSGGSYEGSYDSGSYARGRGSNARRDSMGRYSRESGYSRNESYSYADGMEELLNEMRGMMGDLPDEKRREVQRFVEKMERM